MRIALINSPSLHTRPVSRSMAGGLGFDGHDGMVLPPLDLAIMAATLRQAGEEVELIDADPLGLDAQGVCNRLAGRSWDLLVGTVSLPSLEHDVEFLAQLRSRHPQARIFAKTLIRAQAVLEPLLRKSCIDLAIHGEADLSIIDMAHGRSRQGTAWIEASESGSQYRFEEGTAVHDLNQLPLPARDLLPNERYRYPLLGGPVATLQTSRGCPYPCGYYCPYPLVEGVKWRPQSPERIAAELKQIVEELGTRKIYFRDATFTLNQDRIVRLCDLIVEARWQLEWVCETRVDCLGDAVLERMKAAGCVGILVGVETGDEQVMHRREGKKGLTVPKLAHLREKTRQLGIRLHFLLIVGLPQETRESIVATYDLIQRYKPDTIGVTIITPYPGTPLYEEGIRQGWIESLQWKDYGGHQVPMHSPNMSREDMVAGKRFLEEGFAILQRRQAGDHSQPVEAFAQQHYEQLLRWAYRLDAPLAQLRRLVSQAPRTPVVAHPQPSAKAAVSALPLSVVIPAYNRRAILRKTLLALESQTIPPEQFEVIVVDDGSSDDTMAMLKQFKASFTLKALSQPHQGANAARNLAIREASGEIVLITGDDMIPEPAFLEAHLKFHRQHSSELDAMLGFIDWSPEIRITPFMHFIVSPEGGQQFAFHVVREGKADFRLFYTSNISLKRSLLLEQTTLFDQDFTYPAYDDTELGYRLARQGMQIHYNPMAVTRHHHEITVEGFVHRQRKAGHMAVILARKHPELDGMVLGLQDILHNRGRYTEEHVRGLLEAISELQKPDLGRLGVVRLNNQGYDHFYTRNILYPLYNALLQAAYAWGVCEAAAAHLQAQPVGQEAGAGKQIVASIIIPVFNKLDLTKQCLVKLAEVTHGVEYEVIIVDNASSDGTAEFLSQLGGDVQIIRNSENLGFAKGCNQGAKAAKGRYLVFLNNDTIPLDGWLQAMVEEVEQHPDVAVVGSKLLYEDGTIQHAGVGFSRIFFTPYHLYRMARADMPAVNYRREFQCVTGACMLIRREVFEKVGGFDEGYRNGFEDVDLCLKVGEEGWKIVYQPTSVVYHLESQTQGRKAHDQENAQRFLQRWTHKWWITDEDALYFADGYACHVRTENGMLHNDVRRLTEPDREQWRLVAEAQQAAQRQDFATVKHLLAQAKNWPSDAWVLRWGALVCRRAGVPELAMAFWERILSIEEDPDARIALARFVLDQGQFEQADSHVNILLSRNAQHGEGWFLRGIIAMQRQACGEAAIAFERAGQFGADVRKARLGAGMALMGLGQAEPAWERFSGLLKDNPDDVEAIQWLLRAGTALQWWDELQRRLTEYLVRNPGDIGIRFALAGVFLRLDHPAAARKEHDTIKILNPTFDGLAELEQALADKEASLTHSHVV